jgi:signal-transduction protein with cAMP-binding, CBS, and nucleotidyltransferase domain
VELELGVAKALHQKLLLEEPRPAVLGVAQAVIQQQVGRSGKVFASGDLDPVTPVAESREAAAQRAKKTTVKKVTGNERPVSKLRPKPPITMLDTDTIFAVAEAMASRRADAALLIDSKGQLSGIITDNDITRRVVSQFIDPKVTCVDAVMTKGPKCVQEDDSALDALEMMVDNRFRHLPVMDKKGTVMGLLDIAKCLYDAISALERVQVDTEASGSEKTSATAVSDAMMMAMKAAGSSNKKGSKLQMEAMQALMESMFGGAVPTLKTIIGLDKIPRLLPTQSVRDASIMMAAVRKGILVMSSDDKLVGILTPKDLLSRVTAKGLNPDKVTLAEVMTPNPETVVSDLTLLDALKEMHDQKFLHLPVRDQSSGAVVGLVDVMELVCSTAGGDEEGGKGWRDFFSGAMAAGGDDGESELSYGSSLLQNSSHKSGKAASVHSRDDSKLLVKAKARNDERPVSRLRPKVPITMVDTDTIFAVAEAMASRRADAALLIDSKGQLSGIITDNDITRRVVSQFVDPMITCVDAVMTKGPKCVQEDDSALDALEMMVDNRFRHLPVMDKKGTVMGLLDIAKCLYDAISALEKVDGSSDNASENSKTNSTQMTEVMMMAMKAAGSSNKKGSKLQMEAMQALMESMFGGAVPTLKTIIGDDALPCVRPSANVREAAILMAEVRKGVLVMSTDNELVGILTPKDILTRVVAKGKSADLTAVSSVMTPNPECASADLTLLDALKEMHDQKFLHLPVRDQSTGLVVGLVDVMELVCSTAGGEEGGKGWRDFFSGAMAAGGGGSQSGSETAHSDNSRRLGTGRKLTKRDYEDTSDIYPVESNKQAPRSGYSHNFETGSVSYVADFAFKVTDSMGNVHRLKSSAESLQQLKIAVGEKLNALSSALVLRYIDDEKEHVVLSSDVSLRDAVDFAKQAGMSALKLTASVTTLMVTPTRGDRMLTDGKADYPTAEIPVYNGTLSKSTKESNALIMIGGGVAAFLAIGAFVFMKSRK